jgi:hypothetical protein
MINFISPSPLGVARVDRSCRLLSTSVAGEWVELRVLLVSSIFVMQSLIICLALCSIDKCSFYLHFDLVYCNHALWHHR